MVSSGLDQLTPRERECLQLVAEGRSSKEIAQMLDLSPYTVDEYIRSGVAKLSASNRREAARMVAAESDAPLQTPEKFGDEPPDVAPDPDSQAAIHPVRSEEPPRWRFPFLRLGRRFNDLSVYQRLVWILLGAVAIVILFSQLANGLMVIQAIFKGR